MRFMLLQNYGGVEADCAPMYEWTPEEVKAHIVFQQTLNERLEELGELVDAQGRVVQTVVTTNTGNYRFRNVDGGNYKVRAAKQGFKAVETEVHAAPAAPAAKAANMSF